MGDSLPYKTEIVKEYTLSDGKVLGICKKINEQYVKFYIFLHGKKSEFRDSENFPRKEQIRNAARHLKTKNPFYILWEAEEYITNLQKKSIGLSKIDKMKYKKWDMTDMVLGKPMKR